MKFEDLTAKILACCFEVSNELGCGFLESVYQKALLIALADKGLAVEAQKPLDVHFRCQSVGCFFADIVVEEKVLLELKALNTLCPEHIAQVLNYLKASNLPVGLLVNFGKSKLDYRRINNRMKNISI